MRGQTNFVRMLWKFNSVYNPQRQLADHRQPVTYKMRPPMNEDKSTPIQKDLYVHTPLTVSAAT